MGQELTCYSYNHRTSSKNNDSFQELPANSPSDRDSEYSLNARSFDEIGAYSSQQKMHNKYD